MLSLYNLMYNGLLQKGRGIFEHRARSHPAGNSELRATWWIKNIIHDVPLP